MPRLDHHKTLGLHSESGTGAVNTSLDIGPSGDPNYGTFYILSTPSVAILQVCRWRIGYHPAHTFSIEQSKAHLQAASTAAAANIGTGSTASCPGR